MQMRAALWPDVECVFDRLSAQNRAEIADRGWSMDDAKRSAVAFMFGGRTQCLWFDDAPQAVISIARVGDEVVTWFMATEECLVGGIGPIRIGRKYMRDAVSRFGPINSYLTGQHPRLAKWMELLGARPLRSDAGCQVFQFA